MGDRCVREVAPDEDRARQRVSAVYEVISSLGVGGMGEVYLAKDTRLGREVALKVLPDALAHDQERRSRFEREARVLASLNHPEYRDAARVPPSSAATRCSRWSWCRATRSPNGCRRRPLSVDEVLPIFKQIALALESAHDRGIIHRDLKPSNVKVMPDGRVKVLDFGLAKALDRSAAARFRRRAAARRDLRQPQPNRDDSRHRALHESRAGARPAARSPHRHLVVRLRAVRGAHRQAPRSRGQHLRHAGGDPAGKSRITRRLRFAPPPLQRIIRRCLRKDQQSRLRDIADARIEIDEMLQRHGEDAAGRPGPVASRLVATRRDRRRCRGARARGTRGRRHVDAVRLLEVRGSPSPARVAVADRRRSPARDRSVAAARPLGRWPAARLRRRRHPAAARSCSCGRSIASTRRRSPAPRARARRSSRPMARGWVSMPRTPSRRCRSTAARRSRSPTRLRCRARPGWTAAGSSSARPSRATACGACPRTAAHRSG